MTERPVPNHCARGITRRECVNGDSITRCAFSFDRMESKGLKEVSVQWLDDRKAEAQMKARMKDDHPQFVLGFAVLRTEDLERLSRVPKYRDMKYARAPSEGNPYHGLITIPYSMRDRELAAELALLADKYDFEDELPVG